MKTPAEPDPVERLARRAREASRVLGLADSRTKDAALRAMAAELRRAAPKLIEANQAEVGQARGSGQSSAFVDRLILDEARLESVARALERIAELQDPVGRVSEYATRPNGLRIRKMKVPIGLIAVIYEARPGVTADAAGLCVKSGNAVILKGGKEAVRTNAAIAEALQAGLAAAGLPAGAVGFIQDAERSAVGRLLSLEGLVDLVIPRGGPELTGLVRRESRIPILAHDKGLCHTFVDESADLSMAEEIAFNAKAERPGVCNAMETLLVHQAVARNFLPRIARRLEAAGVELRGCPRTLEALPGIRPAQDADWDAEYLDLILSIRVVASFDEAIDHIARHGSGLAEAIVTEDAGRGERFLREVDAGAVYVNASTRFTDGGEFGMGAEMGVSTQKLHARGPVGLAELTCEKFVVTGTGQVRDSRNT